MAASVDPAQLSPKVKAAGIWGGVTVVALTLVSAFLEGLTAEHLEPLGIWAGPIGGVITAAVVVIAAYRKLDPLRQNTAYQHELLTKGPENVG